MINTENEWNGEQFNTPCTDAIHALRLTVIRHSLEDYTVYFRVSSSSLARESLYVLSHSSPHISLFLGRWFIPSLRPLRSMFIGQFYLIFFRLIFSSPECFFSLFTFHLSIQKAWSITVIANGTVPSIFQFKLDYKSFKLIDQMECLFHVFNDGRSKRPKCTQNSDWLCASVWWNGKRKKMGTLGIYWALVDKWIFCSLAVYPVLWRLTIGFHHSFPAVQYINTKSTNVPYRATRKSHTTANNKL